ncbi:hypothetical protein R1flu_029096 [Riccia fluitans]|uniref:Uncharacterized protein n=1 Tax=Riccia fluitans TaxID=41844 RepID=A0ABD1XNJ4_9MARC
MKSAFLNRDLDEEVYLKLPEGFSRNDMKEEPVDQSLYCEVVEKLLYLTNSRPDISYSVGVVFRMRIGQATELPEGPPVVSSSSWTVLQSLGPAKDSQQLRCLPLSLNIEPWLMVPESSVGCKEYCLSPHSLC